MSERHYKAHYCTSNCRAPENRFKNEFSQFDDILYPTIFLNPPPISMAQYIRGLGLLPVFLDAINLLSDAQ